MTRIGLVKFTMNLSIDILEHAADDGGRNTW